MSYKKSALLVAVSLAIFLSIFGLFTSQASFFGLQDHVSNISAIFVVLFFVWTVFALSIVHHYESRLEQLQRLTHDTIHEIATPTATIKANCKMLKAGKSDEKELRRLDRIELCATRLGELYSTLEWRIKNDFSMNERSEAVNVVNICKECAAIFEQPANEKNVKFELNLEPLSTTADLQGLKLAVSNILDNAVKFCSKNSVVTVSTNSGTLTISNVGKELTPSELIAIYDRYFRLENNQRGFGIGLSIVKNFCDANGVHIKIESENEITKVVLKFNEI